MSCDTLLSRIDPRQAGFAEWAGPIQAVMSPCARHALLLRAPCMISKDHGVIGAGGAAIGQAA